MAKETIFIILVLFLTACIQSPSTQEIPYVNLDNLQPLPTPIENKIKPLRVAIAAVISPQGTTESYAPLLNYFAETLGRPVEVLQRRTYSEVNELIRRGEVDLAFVCTSQYIVGKREFGLKLLAAPMVQGETVYRAKIIVPNVGTALGLDDLRGAIFAFTDPISFTGRMYPTYLLQQKGETPETFFGRTFFTYSHDDSIYAIADGVADGASVDALVLDFALKRDPSLGTRVRVIHTSEPFGIPPVVVGPHIRPQLKAQLLEILLNMHEDQKGKEALQALDYDRFVIVSEDIYKSAEDIESATYLKILEEQ